MAARAPRAVAATPTRALRRLGRSRPVAAGRGGPFGDLSFAGCIGDRAGCTPTYPAGALDGAEGMAVTADGAHLYTASAHGNVVSHFKIARFTTAGG